MARVSIGLATAALSLLLATSSIAQLTTVVVSANDPDRSLGWRSGELRWGVPRPMRSDLEIVLTFSRSKNGRLAAAQLRVGGNTLNLKHSIEGFAHQFLNRTAVAVGPLETSGSLYGLTVNVPVLNGNDSEECQEVNITIVHGHIVRSDVFSAHAERCTG